MKRIQSIQLQVLMASYSMVAHTLVCCQLAALTLCPSWRPARMPFFSVINDQFHFILHAFLSRAKVVCIQAAG